jgi:hypothetical protein
LEATMFCGCPPLVLAKEVLSALAAAMCCDWKLVGAACFSRSATRSWALALC